MREELDKLISEYNETKRCLEMGIEWLPENDFAKAIIKIAQDKIMSEYLVRRGYENVKRFSWGRSAEYIRDIIKSYDDEY